MERSTFVEYVWKDEQYGGETMALCVIVNDEGKYNAIFDYELNDAGVWFYYKDEDEFRRAFDADTDEFEFTIVREM